MEADNITLIGMPGAGKSTLGAVLASRLGMRFVDTDLLVQEGTGRPLSELLAERGSEGFIELESRMISGLECSGHVIATGGSAVYGEAAMRHLRTLGRVVFIELSIESLRRRLHGDLMERGVVTRGAASFAELYEERQPLYRRYADLTVRTDRMGTREAVEALCAALRGEEG